jgi:hypothetical protein
LTKLPWFPFFVDDWDTDPNVRAMGPVARSHYLILLILQWREGHIPDSRKTLKRLLVLPLDPLMEVMRIPADAGSEDDSYLVDEEAVLDQILACFKSDGNGGLVNPKMQAIRNQQLKLTAARSKGGQHRSRTVIGQFKDSSSSPPQKEIKKEIKNKKELKAFIHPTHEEVATYCTFRGKGVDPNKWYDHYESNGWKVGRNRMQDWRAAIRTWETNQFGGGNGAKQQDSKAVQRARGNAAAIRAGLGIGGNADDVLPTPGERFASGGNEALGPDVRPREAGEIALGIQRAPKNVKFLSKTSGHY